MTPDRYAVIGDPVGHSLSPVMHGAAFRAAGIDATYDAVHIPADRLAEGVITLRDDGLRGFNVTIPHKVAVMQFMKSMDAVAERVGAVNTVVVRDDGVLHGYNTDVYGFAAVVMEAFGEPVVGNLDVPVGTVAPVPVRPRLRHGIGTPMLTKQGCKNAAVEDGGKERERAGAQGRARADRDRSHSPYADMSPGADIMSLDADIPCVRHMRAVVFGAGGSAQAVVHALDMLGVEIAVVSREGSRAERLAAGVTSAQGMTYADDRLPLTLQRAHIVVNTTPLGMAQYPLLSPLPAGATLEPGTVAIDLVYGRETPFQRQARAQGCCVFDGIEMLVQQGAESFRIWTGSEPDLVVMRAACRARLEELGRC